jgi:hypothetical protein
VCKWSLESGVFEIWKKNAVSTLAVDVFYVGISEARKSMPTKQRKAMFYRAVNGTLNALDGMKKRGVESGEWKHGEIEEVEKEKR